MNLKKVIDMSTFFMSNAGGRIPYLKLMKLLYLSDRKCLEQFGYSMSEDTHYSMKYGPILSVTLDLLRNKPVAPKLKNEWSKFIKTDDYDVEIENSSNLSSLSQADTQLLEQIWEDYQDVEKFDLAEFTHQFCPEWKDPGNSRIKIETSDIFEALNMDTKIKEAYIMHQKEQDSIANIFGC